MRYFNIQLHGIAQRPHPVLHNILNVQEAKKLRLHLKFLTCDLFSMSDAYATCKLCPCHPNLSEEHVLISCVATKDIKDRLFPELMVSIAQAHPENKILSYIPPPWIPKFVLDCTSFNLPVDMRVPAYNPFISEIYFVSRNWCFGAANAWWRHFRSFDE